MGCGVSKPNFKVPLHEQQNIENIVKSLSRLKNYTNTSTLEILKRLSSYVDKDYGGDEDEDLDRENEHESDPTNIERGADTGRSVEETERQVRLEAYDKARIMIRKGIIFLINKIIVSYKNGRMSESSNKLQHDCLVAALELLSHLSGIKRQACKQIQSENLHKLLFQLLDQAENIDDRRSSKGLGTKHLLLMHQTLFNCMKWIKEISGEYRSCDGVRIFNKYRESKDEELKEFAELNFAFVVKEKDKDLMKIDKEVCETFYKYLKDAMETRNNPIGVNEDHKSSHANIQPYRILQAINRLAQNDDNKETIASSELLPCYIALLDPEKFSDKELIESAKGLWLLSFREKSRSRLIEAKAIAALRKLKAYSKNKRVRNYAVGAIIGIKNTEINRKTIKKSALESKHIMLSYNWDNKPLMLEIRKGLEKAGYEVWMDVTDMSGNITDAMAEGVEKSSMVLIGITEKYQNSVSCRQECEYAAKLQKPIIPLLLPPKHDPTGWLGLLKGQKLHFDFTKKGNFQTKFKELLKEIEAKGARPPTSKVPPGVPPLLESHTGPRSAGWTEEKKNEWLKDAGLGHLLERLRHVRGETLTEYKHLMQEDPKYFNKAMKKNLKLSFEEIISFRHALRKL